MMSNNQKGIQTVFVFAMVTLLSCCFSPVSSYFALPRVSRTKEAIIIDYEGVGYSPFSLGRGYGQIVDPGYIPLPAFNPYAMMQPQPMFYNGWYNFGRQVAPAPAPVCGKGPTTFPISRALTSERIAGGGPAKKGTWPFMVALKKTGESTSFCSGSLVSETKVLLAAQCLEKFSVYEISALTVLVGSWKTDQSDAQMTRRISKVVIHSQYNAATYANDIAIITLDMPVVLSKTVSTVCLAPGGTDPDVYQDQAAIVLGWDASPAIANLFQGLVAIQGSGDCRADGVIGQFSTANTMCVTSGPAATGPTAIYTCLKDVGGPVVINTAPATAGAPAVYIQVGINSYTKDCTASTGLKTRVGAYADWIKTCLAY